MNWLRVGYFSFILFFSNILVDVLTSVDPGEVGGREFVVYYVINYLITAGIVFCIFSWLSTIQRVRIWIHAALVIAVFEFASFAASFAISGGAGFSALASLDFVVLLSSAAIGVEVGLLVLKRKLYGRS